MQPECIPLFQHPFFARNDFATEAWWQAFQQPLQFKQHENSQTCVFLWRQHDDIQHVYIDVYSQTPSIYQTWNAFKKIPDSDVFYYTLELPHDWSGSYVIVESNTPAPNSTDKRERRLWWQAQLQHSVQDPHNLYPAYRASMARLVNQCHLNGAYLDQKTSDLISFQLEVDDLSIQMATMGELTAESPTVILLDGQWWCHDLSILNQIAQQTQAQTWQAARYIFIHTQQRQKYYGCVDAFHHILVQQLFPYLQAIDPSFSPKHFILVGQSLGATAALYLALNNTQHIQGLILQSGAYWWSDFSQSHYLFQGSTLLQHLQRAPQTLSHVKHISISAGSLETDMRQDAVHLFQALQPTTQVEFQIFSGGHDAIHWRKDLLRQLDIHLSANPLSHRKERCI